MLMIAKVQAYNSQLHSVTPHPILPADYDSNALFIRQGCKTIASCSQHCLSTEDCESFVYSALLRQCTLFAMTLANVLPSKQPNSLHYGEKALESKLGNSSLTNPKGVTEKTNIPEDCEAYYENGERTSGIYTIRPSGSESFSAYCDFVFDHGWTVIQKRQDGSVDFYRNWTEYKTGFGDKDGEYWIGNDNLHALTQTNYKLNVFMRTWDNVEGHANYATFTVSDEGDCYRLNVAGYSGTTSDGLAGGVGTGHNGRCFITHDHTAGTQNIFCPMVYRGAWWYHDCKDSNLNGVYESGNTTTATSAVWSGEFDTALHYIVMRVTRI